MKKVVLSALFAIGLCFGLAAAPDANAPAGKSGKPAVKAVSAKAKSAPILRNKDASLGNSSNGLSSILEIKEPGQKKKRSKADDDTRGR